ncbi:DUF998 domain-containing protein [bacterium]|nr:DUF998 domain-containing protein [bacterium]
MAGLPPSQSNKALVLSYLDIRKAIGIIGIALPLALAIGKYFIDGPGMESSISHYYYTGMRNVLVGSLCAIAVFLLSYRGYERKDELAGDFACIFAIGVAFFPTTPVLNATERDKIIGILHLIFATAFFSTLAYFSLALFRIKDKTKIITPRKKLRNHIYLVCGCTILACIVLIAMVSLLSPESPIKQHNPVFWLEAIAIWAFGWSWFTKGEGILKDREV